MRRALLAFVSLVALAAPTAAGAAGDVTIRGVGLDEFPRVQLTAVVPQGSRPALAEDGRPAGYVEARDLGSAQAIVLAVDNSSSMSGRPLREAKRAAGEFLAGRNAGTVGLVAFGHEALALTAPTAPQSDVERVLASLAPDTATGTALYDAVGLSVARLKQMADGTRILVLLTDGHDLGSKSTLARAIAAAKRAHVIVYSIAAGSRSDREPLVELASATGGRLFDAGDSARLGATYRALARELDRTWQISYLSRAHAGDRAALTVRAGGATAKTSAADSDAEARTAACDSRLDRAAARSRPRSSSCSQRSCSAPPPLLDAGAAAPSRSALYSSRTSHAVTLPRRHRRTGTPDSSHCSTGPSGRSTTSRAEVAWPRCSSARA